MAQRSGHRGVQRNQEHAQRAVRHQGEQLLQPSPCVAKWSYVSGSGWCFASRLSDFRASSGLSTKPLSRSVIRYHNQLLAVALRLSGIEVMKLPFVMRASPDPLMSKASLKSCDWLLERFHCRVYACMHGDHYTSSIEAYVCVRVSGVADGARNSQGCRSHGAASYGAFRSAPF